MGDALIEDRALAESRAIWLAGIEALRRGHNALWAHAADRGNGKRLIFLAGDSVALGYGERGYKFDAERPESALQHIDRLINMLAADRGLLALYTGAAERAQIARMLRKLSRTGDVLVYQDWGWRAESYDATYTSFASVASLAREVGVAGLFLNSYARPSAPPSLRFDAPCSDRPAETPNDAIAAAAADYAFGLIDVHSRLGHFDTLCIERLGVGAMHGDGIHPNGLGNAQLARLILGSVVQTTVSVDPLLPMLESALAAGGTRPTQRDLTELFSRADAIEHDPLGL